MRTITLKASIALAIVLALGGTAAAQQSSSTGLGVGGDTLLTGDANGPDYGISVVYDMDKFRVGGLLSYADDGNDTSKFMIAGRALVPVHNGAMSDFSIGGALGLVHYDDPGPDNDFDAVVIEGDAQVRAFVTSNVSLNFTLGFAVQTADADGVGIGAVPVGGAGFTYYFY